MDVGTIATMLLALGAFTLFLVLLRRLPAAEDDVAAVVAAIHRTPVDPSGRLPTARSRSGGASNSSGQGRPTGQGDLTSRSRSLRQHVPSGSSPHRHERTGWEA